MRCLYCGKELALLKRLTGGGDFCSESHKQSYQEEYNRLALSRLLQAQKKGQQAHTPPVNVAPPKAAVALEEPAPQIDSGENITEGLDAPLVEVAVNGHTAQPPVDFARAEESPKETAGHREEIAADPEPVDTAGFLIEVPAVAGVSEQAPFLESWQELSSGPAMSEWLFQDHDAHGLSSADLVSLDVHLNASSIQDHALSAIASPEPLPAGNPNPALTIAAHVDKAINGNRLSGSSRAIAIDVVPKPGEFGLDDSPVRAVAFETSVMFEESQLLDLSTTGIGFPAEDADVLVLPSHGLRPIAAAVEPAATAEPPAEEAAAADGPGTPLEALTRLDQEPAEQTTARVDDSGRIRQADPAEAPTTETKEAEPVEAVATAVAEPPPVEPLADQPPADALAADPAANAAKPKFITETFELSLKIFPPGKPALLGSDAYPSDSSPLLPNLKSLPLRPKVALASGYAPPSEAPSAPTAKPATPTTASRAPGSAKPAVGSKPPTRLAQPKQAAAAPKQTVAAKAAETRPIPVAKPEPKIEAVKPVNSQPSPVLEASAPKPKVPEEAPKTSETATNRQAEKEPTAKPVPTPASAKVPAASPVKPAVDAGASDVPNFGIAQTGGSSFLSSLKFKLGLAILVVAIAGGYFLSRGGGNSGKPAGANPAVSADASGPNIIMGEGGWVEGWAGDPTGLHAGRQITIYRPSLKLSDYRLEFQASIDVKSIGWVFRAADPENYYAMKLMTVSTGLSPKVALFKYLVAKGKQTPVGRVAVDTAVQPDTVFDIRVDVRGSQFTTYIQGQQVDSWTDDQLKIGGAGFLNERDERGKVKSVSIRYLSGPAK